MEWDWVNFLTAFGLGGGLTACIFVRSHVKHAERMCRSLARPEQYNAIRTDFRQFEYALWANIQCAVCLLISLAAHFIGLVP